MIPHVSILRDEVVQVLRPTSGSVLVDCTLGYGGHSEALLSAAPGSRLIGLDRDVVALQAARERLAPFADRLVLVQRSFAELPAVLDELGIAQVDGILADLGVSSPQLDTADRGFSFRLDGPLDMRMGPGLTVTAADVVNTWPVESLVQALKELGEEPKARQVARVIVEGRPWSRTVQLAEAVARVAERRRSHHGATLTFQALRMVVNQELDQLSALLEASLPRLTPGGRLALLTFHSLEDRMVKHFLRREAALDAEKDPWGRPLRPARLRLLPSLVPPRDDPNPRSRSARLRAAEKLP